MDKEANRRRVLVIDFTQLMIGDFDLDRLSDALFFMGTTRHNVFGSPVELGWGRGKDHNWPRLYKIREELRRAEKEGRAIWRSKGCMHDIGLWKPEPDDEAFNDLERFDDDFLIEKLEDMLVQNGYDVAGVVWTTTNCPDLRRSLEDAGLPIEVL